MLATPDGVRANPLRIAFVGDVMLDGGPGHLVTNGRDPFAHVAKALLDNDVTIGNLECAVTRKGHQQDKSYTFKAPVASFALLKRYFSGVSLANNHALDWGVAGFLDELELLREHEVPWFGGGHDVAEARRPLLLTVRGRRIALLAYNDFPPKYFAAQPHRAGTAWLVEKNVVSDIQSAKQSGGAKLVFVYLHWGEELTEEPTSEQTKLARRLIDVGADAILGSHPHVTQTIEWYAGRPIIYSLGNFVFDYFPHDPAIWTSYVVRLEYDESNTARLSTLPVELDAAGIPHPTAADFLPWRTQ
ncbi:MAG: CapA family protein [Polyangiaceae bacterium]